MTVSDVERAEGVAELVAALAAALRQAADLLDRLTDEQYTHKPGGALPSSIGGHVRHNLDHVASLLAGVSAGQLDYDRRERGTAIESDCRANRAGTSSRSPTRCSPRWSATGARRWPN